MKYGKRRQTKSTRRKKRGQLNRILYTVQRNDWQNKKKEATASVGRRNVRIIDDSRYHEINRKIELNRIRYDSFLKSNGKRPQSRSLSTKRAALKIDRHIPSRDSYIILNNDTLELLMTCASRNASIKISSFYKEQGIITLTRRILCASL